MGIEMKIEVDAAILAHMVTRLMHANGTYDDACQALANEDYLGVCGIVNVAMGLPIDSKVKIGLMFRVGDLLK